MNDNVIEWNDVVRYLRKNRDKVFNKSRFWGYASSCPLAEMVKDEKGFGYASYAGIHSTVIAYKDEEDNEGTEFEVSLVLESKIDEYDRATGFKEKLADRQNLKEMTGQDILELWRLG